jgi:hypothetical protein
MEESANYVPGCFGSGRPARRQSKAFRGTSKALNADERRNAPIEPRGRYPRPRFADRSENGLGSSHRAMNSFATPPGNPSYLSSRTSEASEGYRRTGLLLRHTSH